MTDDAIKPSTASRWFMAPVRDEGDLVMAVVERCTYLLHLIGALLVFAVCLLICWDATGRLLFNRPLPGTVELAAVTLVAITYLQLPYVLVRRLLLRVTFVLDRVGPGPRRFLNGAAYGLGFSFFAIIGITSIEPSIASLTNGEFEGMNDFRIPLWPLRIATLVLWAMSAAICLAFAYRALRGRLADVDGPIH